MPQVQGDMTERENPWAVALLIAVFLGYLAAAVTFLR